MPVASPSRGRRFHVLAYVVHAEDRRTTVERGDCDPDGRGDGPDLSVRIAEDPCQRALAREPDQDRPPDRDQLVQAAHELEVLLDGLAEADPGIEADELFAHTGSDGEREPLLEERLHI